MKIKNLFCTFFTFILLLAGFTSCNDSSTTLRLEANTIYLKMGEDLSTYVVGNGGYQLAVSNEAVVTATESNGVIALHPVSIGQATLTVTDSENQVSTMTIHVQEPYMAFGVISVTPEITVSNDADNQIKAAIQKDIEDHYIIRKDYLYNLTINEDSTYVEYQGYWQTTAESGKFSFSGDTMEFTFKTPASESTFTIENNTYGKMFYDYFVSGSVPGTMAEFPIFNLTEDLTLKYREEYPDANISKVEVTSNVQAFIYRAQ